MAFEMTKLRTLRILLLGLMGLIAVASIVFRFQHPELTTTQLFAAIPWAWIGALICILLLGVVDWLAKRSKR